MSKFLSDVKGFTPVIDILAKKMGLMTAVVYGIVWRYCQMEDKKCTASRERIAEHAEISSKTVERHLKKLCDYGYLKDLTPTRKHRPHEYADTGKAKIKGLLIAEVGKTESPTSESGKIESQEGKTESLTRSDTKSSQGKTESLIRIPSYDSIDDSKLRETEPSFPKKPKEPTDPVVEQIIAQTETHPDLFDVAARTAEARIVAGGNYAVPPSAGGDDAFRDGPVDAFCEVLADIVPNQLPQKLRKSWGDKLHKIAKKCSAENLIITPEIMERAIRVIPDDKIGWKTFSSPHSDNFEANIIPLLLRDGQPRQKGAQHEARQRIAKGAVPRRVATEDEARAILG